MKPLTMLFLALCLASACRKQSSQGPEQRQLMPPANGASLSLLQSLLPANPENPYDSAGIIHNRLLAAAQRYVLGTGDTSLSSVREYMAGLLPQKHDAGPGLPDRIATAFPYKVLARAGRIPELSGLSAPAKRYAGRLFTILTDDSGLNYSRIKAGVMDIESAVLADPSLKHTEREALLQTAAIARYSAHHWLTWAGSVQGRMVLYRGYNSPAAITVAVMAMYQADCWAMWYAYAWGLFQEPGGSAEDILLLVSAVSAAGFIMTLNAM